MRKTPKTASDRAFQFFKIDSSKPGAREDLLEAMLQHFFGSQRGRPASDPIERGALFIDCWAVSRELSQKYGRAPKRIEVAREVKARFPDKYRRRSVEYIRQHVIGSYIQKMSPEQRDAYFKQLSSVIFKIDPEIGATPQRRDRETGQWVPYRK